ncbi:hypothetical protein FRC01_014129 [Tulasnella sp. 417]|nr:hypothetical protein FRC01_014129 [Tulasnella sp. 417]
MDASLAPGTTGSSGNNSETVLIKSSPRKEKIPRARSRNRQDTITDLTESISEKISQCDTESKRAQSMCNQVHLVPIEIWTKIFYYTLPPESQAQGETLATVCRYWDMIVNNSPTLWSAICSRDSMETISTSLIKSQQASLDLYGSWGTPLRISPSAIAEFVRRQREFLALVSSHRQRWRFVELRLVAPPNRSLISNHEPNPRLEHLSVSITSYTWPINEPLDLFAGLKPRLRQLSLETVPIQWSTFSALNLSTLRLTDIENLGPHLSQLYDILAACPHLEEVIVESISSLAESKPLYPPRLVELHRLRKLELKYIEARVMWWLLEVLRIPTDCSVLLEEQVKGHPRDSLFPSHPTDLPNKCLSRASRITVTVPMGSVRLTLDGLWGLDLTLDNMDAVREVLLWLDVAEISPRTENLPIEMKWRSSVRLKDGFFNPVCGFGNVRRITICTNFGADCPGTVKYSVTLLFPGLQELRIEDPIGRIVELVVFLLHERQAARKGDMSPDPLRTVVFYGREAEEVAQRSPFLRSETFRTLLDMASASDMQVWWYGKLMTGSEGPDSTSQGRVSQALLLR